MRLFVLPILAPALLKGGSLVLLWQTCKQVRMAGRDAFLHERYGHVGYELQERQTGVDMRCTLARLQDERGHVIAGHIEQSLETLCLFIRMHVYTLRIFDLSLVLQKLSMTSTTMESCTLWNCYL
jgi:hypothetical protein